MKTKAQSHTPVPWKESPWKSDEGSHIDIVGANEVETVATLSEGPIEANVRRIIACVNACEGMNPAAAPKLLEAAIQYRKAVLTLQSQSFGETKTHVYVMEDAQQALDAAIKEATDSNA